MRFPKRFAALLIIASMLLCFATLLAGCQSSGTATTQPSLAETTTATEAALDLAVNAIRTGIDLGFISSADYWRDIDPVITSAQSAVATMRADATAGDESGAQAAEDAIEAAVRKLQPYVTAVQSKAAKPTTKAK